MRRSETDIAVDILRVAMNGARKTQIVFETNLNFTVTHKYLEMLPKNNLSDTKTGFLLLQIKEGFTTK